MTNNQSGGQPPASPPSPYPNLCPPGTQFLLWCSKLIEMVQESGPQILPYAKANLQEKYFAFRNSASKKHRDKMGSKTHQCIYTIWVDTYEQLGLLGLSTAPQVDPDDDLPGFMGTLIGIPSED